MNAAPDRRRLSIALAATAIVAAVALALDRPEPGGSGSNPPATTLPERVAERVRARAMRDDAAIDRVLGYAPVVTAGGTRRRQIALTFDDGPGPSTPALLRYLEAHSVPATFFLLGQSIARHTDLVRRELEAGFTLGTHAESHGRLASRPFEDQRDEILAAAARVTPISGVAVRLFRPPFGAYDAHTLQIMRAERMLMVLWSIDPGDYTAGRSPRQIADAALEAARPGAIVLLHDGPEARPKTLAAVRMLVPALRRRGYRLVSVPELLRDDPPPAPRGAGR